MAQYETIVLIPGFLNLTYIENTGAAFGILSRSESPWVPHFFLGATLVATIILLALYRSARPEQRLLLASYTLILGGAVGNLIDRVRFNSVVDFVDCYIGQYHWPAFNVADSCITVGVILLAGIMLFQKDPKPNPEKKMDV
jgi:signal peptidase II